MIAYIAIYFRMTKHADLNITSAVLHEDLCINTLLSLFSAVRCYNHQKNFYNFAFNEALKVTDGTSY